MNKFPKNDSESSMSFHLGIIFLQAKKASTIVMPNNSNYILVCHLFVFHTLAECKLPCLKLLCHFVLVLGNYIRPGNFFEPILCILVLPSFGSRSSLLCHTMGCNVALKVVIMPQRSTNFPCPRILKQCNLQVSFL